MPLTSKEAFMAGFVARCINDGLPAESIPGCAKAAEDKVAGIVSTALGKLFDVAKGVGTGAVNWGIPLALVAPPVAGAVGGYGLARLSDMDDTDVAEIQDQEVLDEYKRQTEKLRRQKAVRDYQRARKQTGRMFI